MPGDIIGIALELGKVKLAVIVEAQRNPLLILSQSVEDRINTNAFFAFLS